MEDDDKRTHQRFTPKGLVAHVTFEQPAEGRKLEVDGEVVDMSYGGIKIKLDHPVEAELEQAELNVQITLPESGVPVCMHGSIKHLHEDGQCGLQYDSQLGEEVLDELMFECVKRAEGHEQE